MPKMQKIPWSSWQWQRGGWLALFGRWGGNNGFIRANSSSVSRNGLWLAPASDRSFEGVYSSPALNEISINLVG